MSAAAADGGAVGEAILRNDGPGLLVLLKEMKEALDSVRGKVQALTEKVRHSKVPTSEGISYLEAKHLLLLSYCQDIVYYILQKAKGAPIAGHPVVHSLVEIRLFLEKIRPIDKKMEYQIQKLCRAAEDALAPKNAVGAKTSGADEDQDDEDPLKYRPKPDMLISKDEQDITGLYKPPKFRGTSMEDDVAKKQGKQEKRREKQIMTQGKKDSFVRHLIDEMEDRPEEIQEVIGAESKEASRFLAEQEERGKYEEERFSRRPVTKREKQQAKHLLKSRSGLEGLADGFFDEIRLLMPGDEDIGSRGNGERGQGHRRHKKRRRF